jgi:hypothetical protein
MHGGGGGQGRQNRRVSLGDDAKEKQNGENSQTLPPLAFIRDARGYTGYATKQRFNQPTV